MIAPFTRSMTFTLGLFSVAMSPDLWAETDPEPNKTLELGATSTPLKAWAPPPSTPAPTPPAR